jgi:hypothetical protein
MLFDVSNRKQYTKKEKVSRFVIYWRWSLLWDTLLPLPEIWDPWLEQFELSSHEFDWLRLWLVLVLPQFSPWWWCPWWWYPWCPANTTAGIVAAVAISIDITAAIGLLGSTLGLLTGVAGAYLLTSGLLGSGGEAAHFAPIFLPNDLLNVRCFPFH